MVLCLANCKFTSYYKSLLSSSLLLLALSFTLQYMHIIDNSSHHTLLIFILFFSFSSFLSCKKKDNDDWREENILLLFCMLCMTGYMYIFHTYKLVCMNDGIFFNDRCSINVKSSLFLQIILSKCLKRLEPFREIVLI